jgi:hypothetical protein
MTHSSDANTPSAARSFFTQACAALSVAAVVDSQLVLTASDADGEARAPGVLALRGRARLPRLTRPHPNA